MSAWGWLKAPVFAALFAALPAQAQQGFHDDGGRAVTLPARVARVWPAGPPAEVLVYVLAPEKLAGFIRPLSEAARPYFPERYAALPALGRLTGRGNSTNLETVVKAAPDVILDVGTLGPSYVSLADRVQDQTHIPYVLLGGSLADTPALLRRAGAILGVPDRAETLARYTQQALDEVRARVASVPAGDRPKAYIARGPRGLETDVQGSINSETLDFMGARNVVAAGTGAGNLADVSMEQVLAWQPEFVFTIDRDFVASVATDPAWQGVAAVRDRHVYLVPHEPYGWIDDPPGPNRIIGVRWLAKLLYPRLFPEDLRPETKRFYELFYQQSPSDAQLQELLGPPG